MAEKKDYKIVKKKSGRYAVQKRKGEFVNGDEKVKILVKEGLISDSTPKAKPEEAEAAEGEA